MSEKKSEFKQYKRKGLSEMRQVVFGEDLSGISISDPDKELMRSYPNVFDQGYIARNPNNHKDLWYVAKDYFDQNLELYDEGRVQIVHPLTEQEEAAMDGIVFPLQYDGSTIRDAQNRRVATVIFNLDNTIEEDAFLTNLICRLLNQEQERRKL